METAPFAAWLGDIAADLLHVHAGIAWEGHALAAAGRAAGVPVIRTEHLPYVLTDERQKQDHLLWIGLLDHTIFVSKATCESYRRVGASTVQCTTIQNGVMTPVPARSRAQTRVALHIPEDHLVVLTVARFTPQKGHSHLIKAVKQVLQAGGALRLLLVGDGPERGHCSA